MTKTTPAPKISFIREPYQEPSKPASKGKAQAVGDNYKTTGKNAYKSLVIGKNSKAVEIEQDDLINMLDGIDGIEGTDTSETETVAQGAVGDMVDAAENTATTRPLTEYEKYQNLMASIVGMDNAGDGTTIATNEIAEIPVVPDLYKEILYLKDKEDVPMAPVVQRYSALEQVLTEMLDNAKNALSPENSAKMTGGEIMSTKVFKDKVKEALLECRKNLKDSITLYNEELARKEAERIEAENAYRS